MKQNNSTFYQEDNQLIYKRLLNAHRELVWEVWTEPEHLKNWWGPNGFTITHHSQQVEAGGNWRFIMHGFGQDFDNKIEYIEVVKPSLLVYKHGNEQDTMSFMVYISFEEIADKTLLTMRSVFKSAEVIAELNRKVNAIEGGQQTLNKLEAYLNHQLILKK
jgi:uncharacterized protein YndB with AHSA1/START domain